MISGRVIGFTRGTARRRQASAASDAFVVNERSDTSVTQALSERVDVTRLYNYFQVRQTASTNSVTALPTTAAQLSVWNGEPDDGAIYVIDVCGASFVSGNISSAVSLAYCMNVGKKAKPSATPLTIRGTLGQVYQGRGVAVPAQTITDDGWFPLGNSTSEGIGTLVGHTITVNVLGAVIVPPGHMFSIALLTNAGRAAIRWIRWQEVILPVGP